MTESPRTLAKKPFVIAGALLGGILALGVARHLWRDHEAAAFQSAQAAVVPLVRVAKVTRQDGPVRLELPGQTLAIEQAKLFARATGYIAERRADIGDKVKKGDLLTRIAAPDLDQQYAQAIAQLALTKSQLGQATAQVQQVQANLKLADVTLGRIARLVQRQYETRQNYDNALANKQALTATLASAQAGVDVARSTITAQQATADRLKQLIGFKDVVAPFDGVVTLRNIDKGDLVTADAGTGTPLYTMARDDILRVQISVPQTNIPGLADGLDVDVLIAEKPGKTFKGHIARNAASLDANTRTLLIEIDIPNPTGELRPGLFATVILQIPRSQPLINAPAQSILFGANGPQVATVEHGDTVRLKKIVIWRDFGTNVDVRDGLDANDVVILDPPANIQDGGKIGVKE